MFQKVSARVNFSDIEEEILNFWQENKCFEKSLEQRKGCDEFVFYDGPPFATGLPHFGHLLAGTIKDVIPRYQTMKGKYVERVFGWDCHGLPVENEVEKSLNLSSKTDIEDYGIHNFNEECRSIVLKYSNEWKATVERMGRWVDFENGYKTMDVDYMESIWWVFKQLWDKGLVYEGNKIMWYCPRCSTPLSNFEVQQGYKDVVDPAITVRFQHSENPNKYFLAWTTTPWTLSSNLALTVGEDIDYVEVDDDGIIYILAEARVSAYWKEAPNIVNKFKGSELLGQTYKPLYDYFEDLRAEGAFKVISGDFVTTADGTGIVHTAPGFGEDDAAAGKANGIPAVCPIDNEGKYTEEVSAYTGRFVKDCDKEIIRALKESGDLIHRTDYKHNYPHCWRCKSPLLNKAISTWFVSVESVKDKMLAANNQINWVPSHLKAGRFGKWLENARDWAISRNRYWGCPLPIWRNVETGEAKVFGSVAELEEACGHKVDDIHKHFVDDIIIDGEKGKLTRVPEVLDCWFESGSMPYAQKHFPFNNEEWFKENYPADFIAEGLDQTRGWFYTLTVLGAALFDKPAFQNVIVNGLILDKHGKKLSKSERNYTPPEEIFEKFGADALRLSMLSTPVVRGEAMRFSDDLVSETLRSVMIPFWNSYYFFTTFANTESWVPEDKENTLPANLSHRLDRWIISRLEGLVHDVSQSLDSYELQPAGTRFVSFVDELTKEYIARNRPRFWTGDKEAFATLYHVLITFSKAAAPFIPFITEKVYQNLKTDSMPISVHLCDYPQADLSSIDQDLDRKINYMLTTANLGRRVRKAHGLKLRQPLRELILVSHNAQTRADLEEMKDVIADDLNVKEILINDNESELVHLSAKANFAKLGRRLGKKMKVVAAKIAEFTVEEIESLRQGSTLNLNLDDENIEIVLDDIEVRRDEKEGLVVANEGDITIALDIKLSDELIIEGYRNELVRLIQDTRKKQNLDVSDRIVVSLDLSEKLSQAVEKYSDYISQETLADKIDFRTQTSFSEPIDLELGEEKCKIMVVKS